MLYLALKEQVLYRLVGNPRHEEDVNNCIQWALQQSQHHIVEGRQSLMPWEVRKIREYLLKQNNLWGLQMWAMVNLQIHLGLRQDDLVNLKFSDILLNLSLIKDDCTVESLFLQFNGKSEKKGSMARYYDLTRLKLWADHQFPMMCPIKALLGYIYLAGLKSGYVFPRSHLLGSIDHATELQHKQMSATYLNDCKDVFERVTGNYDIYGTHTGRKTYYLLGVLGGADTIVLKQGARHKQDSTVETYLQDAVTIKEMIDAQGMMSQCEVSKWKSIFCKSETNVSKVAKHSLQVNMSLDEVASTFIEQTCKIQGNVLFI